MLRKSLRNMLDKTKEEKVRSRTSLAIPTGNHIHRKTIFAAICALTIVILGTMIFGFGYTIHVAYAGSVKGIGVGIYQDQTCLNRPLLLDWGHVEAGSNNTLTVYIKNECNSAVSLSLSTSNWTPSSSSSYISLNWNYSGQTLSANQVIPLKLTLTVDSNITGITGFSFGTVITTTSES